MVKIDEEANASTFKIILSSQQWLPLDIKSLLEASGANKFCPSQKQPRLIT